MRYTAQKAFLAVVTSIFIVIGCLLLLGSAMKGVADIYTIIGGAFARMARELRSLITSLEQHPDLKGEHPATFKAWRNEALDLAESLDPMKRPIVDLLGDLGEPGA